MEIKRLGPKHLDDAFSIILNAKRLLSSSSLQWQRGYPYRETIEEDIRLKRLYGYFEHGELLGIMALVPGFNEDYAEIEGSWGVKTGAGDLTIHRIAVKSGHHGEQIGDALMGYAMRFAAERGYCSVKADTHAANKAMQRLCENAGMIYRGIIHILREKEDNARLAYERVLRSALPKEGEVAQ